MDQAAPAHQDLLRNHFQRSEDPNLDRDLRLSACGDREKEAWCQGQPLQNSPDRQRHDLRENASFTGLFRHRYLRFRWRRPQPIESIQLTLGQ